MRILILGLLVIIMFSLLACASKSKFQDLQGSKGLFTSKGQKVLVDDAGIYWIDEKKQGTKVWQGAESKCQEKSGWTRKSVSGKKEYVSCMKQLSYTPMDCESVKILGRANRNTKFSMKTHDAIVDMTCREAD